MGESRAQAEAQAAIERRERRARRARRTRRITLVCVGVVVLAAAGFGVFTLFREVGVTITSDADAGDVLQESVTRDTRGIVALLDDGSMVRMTESGEQVELLLSEPEGSIPITTGGGGPDGGGSGRGNDLAARLTRPTLTMAPDGEVVYVGRFFLEDVADCPEGARNRPKGGRISSVPLDGSEPEVVAQGVAPSVSADGRWLAYTSNGTCDELPELIVHDLTGEEPDRAFGDPDKFPVDEPSWTPDGDQVFVSTLDLSPCEECLPGEVIAVDVDSAESLADGTPVGDEPPGCLQWPMVAAGADVVAAINASCGVSEGRLGVTDAETRATSPLSTGTPEESTIVELNAEGGRLLLVEFDAATSTNTLVAWSPDDGRTELGDGIAAAVFILA